MAREISKQYDDDDEDSDNSDLMYEDSWVEDDIYGNHTARTGKRKVPEPAVSEDDVCLFLHAVQYNVLFDMGFKVQGSSKNDEVNCYCPCRRHMEPWAAQFFLTDISGK